MINHVNRKKARLTVKERAAAGSALNFALAGAFEETFGDDCGFTREEAEQAQLKVESGATLPILPDFVAALEGVLDHLLKFYDSTEEASNATMRDCGKAIERANATLARIREA